MSQLRRIGLWGFVVGVMVASGVVCSAVSEAAEKWKEVAQEVDVPVVEVRDQAIKSTGTGTLHLAGCGKTQVTYARSPHLLPTGTHTAFR